MKSVATRFNAALTVSAELKKIVLLYWVAYLLSLPKKSSLFFLTELYQLILSWPALLAAIIAWTEEPLARMILETVCQPIMKTGPPAIWVVTR